MFWYDLKFMDFTTHEKHIIKSEQKQWFNSILRRNLYYVRVVKIVSTFECRYNASRLLKYKMLMSLICVLSLYDFFPEIFYQRRCSSGESKEASFTGSWQVFKKNCP